MWRCRRWVYRTCASCKSTKLNHSCLLLNVNPSIFPWKGQFHGKKVQIWKKLLGADLLPSGGKHYVALIPKLFRLGFVHHSCSPDGEMQEWCGHPHGPSCRELSFSHKGNVFICLVAWINGISWVQIRKCDLWRVRIVFQTKVLTYSASLRAVPLLMTTSRVSK